MLKKLNFWILFFPLTLGFLITLAIFTLLNPLPTKLPLFYSVAWGENQLATHREFLVIPASIGIITLLNFVVSWQLHPSQSFFKRILIFFPVIASLILVISFIKIVLNFIL